MWTADIGCWEKGLNIDLPGVKNLSEAIDLAEKILRKTDFYHAGIKSGDSTYVVQIYHNGKIVWDYMSS